MVFVEWSERKRGVDERAEEQPEGLIYSKDVGGGRIHVHDTLELSILGDRRIIPWSVPRERRRGCLGQNGFEFEERRPPGSRRGRRGDKAAARRRRARGTTESPSRGAVAVSKRQVQRGLCACNPGDCW